MDAEQCATLQERVRALEAENTRLRVALRDLVDAIPPCACGDGYSRRGLVDPACMRHEVEPTLGRALEALEGGDGA